MNNGETVGVVGALLGVAACALLLVGTFGVRPSSGGSSAKVENIMRAQAKYDGLRQRHGLLSQAVKNRDKEYEEIDSAIREAKQMLLERQDRLAKGKTEVAEAERDYTDIVSVMEDYQLRYRESMRLKAAGESLGDLKVRNGASYQEVFIQRVTDAGLEIRHLTGSARIAPEDLPEKLQERFQWDPEKTAEARAREKQYEEAYQSSVAQNRVAVTREARLQSASVAVTRLSLLRYQIYKTRNAYNEAIARTHLVRGTRFASRRLGTWEEHALQLSAETEGMLRQIEQLELDLLNLERTIGQEKFNRH